MSQALPEDPLLSPEELVARWSNKISERTLANWRYLKRGPKYQKTGGKVLYPLSEIVAYETRNRVNGTDENNR